MAGAGGGNDFLIACYVCTAVILVAFAVFAVYLTGRMPKATANTNTFITARNTQPTYRIAWSFYASSIGAWAIFLPASFTTFGGWVSIITYAVATALPLLIIAGWGAAILKHTPEVSSFNDFALKYYGRVAQGFVILLSLMNMSVSLISEYTAIGDLFEHYVGGERIGIIIFVGTTTALYTASGGLLVSIVTDQAQAIVSLLLITVASLYLAATFRGHTFPTPLPENLDVNQSGLSSIFSLPISLVTSAVYTEALWQRVWAAQDRKSLLRGASFGFVITVVVIAFFGLIGFLGQWASLPPLDENNNLAFFVIFANGGASSSWVRVLLVVLAATMNESGVDSLQNAIVATLSSTVLADKPVSWSRVAVFLVNVPLIVIALQGYALLDIFLVMNIITTCASFPLLSGLWLSGVSGVNVLLSSALSLFLVCVLGAGLMGGVEEGLTWTFSCAMNGYDWRIFLVGSCSSVFFTMAFYLLFDRRIAQQQTGPRPPSLLWGTNPRAASSLPSSKTLVVQVQHAKANDGGMHSVMPGKDAAVA